MKRILLLLTAFATLLACTKNDPNPEQEKPSPSPDLNQNVEYSLAKGSVIIEGSILEKVTVIDDEHIRFSGVSDTDIPKVGQIIICPASKNTPYGFMGRVVSAPTKAGNIDIEVEPVGLEEAFDDFYVSGTFDIANYDAEFEDSDGNTIPIVHEDNKVWDEIEENDENNGDTKATYNVAKTFSIPVNKVLKGKIYSSVACAITIESHKGSEPLVDLVFSETTGIKGTFEKTMAKGELDIPLGRLAVPIPLGPLVLRPQWTVHVGTKFEGENSIKAEINATISNTTTTLSNKTGQYISNCTNAAKGIELAAIKWESHGSCTLYLETALRWAVVNDKILSFGLGARAYETISGDIDIEINNKDLLKLNPSVTYIACLDAFVYVYSKALNKYEKSFQLLNHTEKASLLTTFSGGSINTTSTKASGKSIVVSAKQSAVRFMKETERGFALFKKGMTVPERKEKTWGEHTGFVGALAKSGEDDKTYEVVFDNIDNPSDYEVKAYVVAQEGEYYYKSIGKKVKRVKMAALPEYPNYRDFELFYDGETLIKAFDHATAMTLDYYYGTNNLTATCSGPGILSGSYSYTIHFREDGFPSGISSSDGYRSYGYTSDHISSVDYLHYEWEKGNMVQNDFYSVEYGDKIDKLNINYNWFFIDCFSDAFIPLSNVFLQKIPGTTSKNLPRHILYKKFPFEITYSFDNEEYPTTMTLSGQGSRAELYFTYE